MSARTGSALVTIYTPSLDAPLAVPDYASHRVSRYADIYLGADGRAAITGGMGGSKGRALFKGDPVRASIPPDSFRQPRMVPGYGER